ncbi:DNA-binding response regulator [Rheinheimera sp. SA_1]|uniref:response regulator n=1 Tax=Rheinheimera sp. SA_1 TaxID=1827365 RepID=UPI0007FBA715|nr:response regulator transcription factor [Rheinheimera sp. SA_1]OBP15551.1 DNA-binding response regulator [Rheinheimera sp. SA_1]
MIRIAVIDDQTLVRQGIVSLLSLAADLTVVVQAANGAGIVELVQQHQVDVILMDIQMPQVSGIDALHLLNQAHLKVPVIILTTFDDNDRVLQAMQAGARGYLLKDVALELLVDAIHTVHRGGSLLQPAITDKILASFLQRKTDEPSAEDQHAEALSGKELEILRLLATGFSNREIAAAVFKSEGTVKNQVSAILGKLGVRDRTKAVLKAIDLGLLG